jgi:hypothetical protein
MRVTKTLLGPFFHQKRLNVPENRGLTELDKQIIRSQYALLNLDTVYNTPEYFQSAIKKYAASLLNLDMALRKILIKHYLQSF